MDYMQSMKIFWHELGTNKIMALATSEKNHPSIRNVSCIMIDKKIFFKTDQNFSKTQQLLKNPNIALCYMGVQIEGKALNHGLVASKKNIEFQKLYQEFWENSYTSHPHIQDEILIEVQPTIIEIWNQDENNNGFQLTIDINNQKCSLIEYDLS